MFFTAFFSTIPYLDIQAPLLTMDIIFKSARQPAHFFVDPAPRSERATKHTANRLEQVAFRKDLQSLKDQTTSEIV
ncbi:MAG: hypothetical protein CSA20_08290 [Deltaproteobacteria bacterium]|nr:MAG: hypothetical protein CSA20_08290 [Deltaproteobacteria bacterium]